MSRSSGPAPSTPHPSTPHPSFPTPPNAHGPSSAGTVAPSLAAALIVAAALQVEAAVPFTLQGPGVQPAHFHVTEFATGLNFPLGMAELADGSLLVASTDGPSYFSSNGRLIRLVDANQDGRADGPPTTQFTGLSGGLTSVRVHGRLVFVTGQSRPITVLRMGPTPADPLTEVGRLTFTYPSGGWLHPHSALAVRPVTSPPGACDLIFQVGSRVNFGLTTQTVSVASTGLGGFSGTLQGDAIHAVRVVDSGSTVTVGTLRQLATGVRNAAGFDLHPKTGDLWFEDNGIDGLVDANEPTSADELNVLPAARLDAQGPGPVTSYGFPGSYVAYRTGATIGGQGQPPVVAFLPLPNPSNGAESEGPNDIAFAPPTFPPALANGVFVTFHGRFGAGGTNNEENPLVFVNLDATNYFHVIPPRLPGVGHIDGLLATRQALFASDLSTNGSLASGIGRGVIYRIQALVGPPLEIRGGPTGAQLQWGGGVLQGSPNLPGTWEDLTNASPYAIPPERPHRFFRIRY